MHVSTVGSFGSVRALLVLVGFFGACRPALPVVLEDTSDASLATISSSGRGAVRRPPAAGSGSVGVAAGPSPALLAQLPELSCEGVPAAIAIATSEALIQGVAVAGDTLYFASANGVYGVPKDGRGPANKLHPLSVPSSLAVLGGLLFFAEARSVGSVRLDGAVGGTTFALDSSFTLPLVSDGRNLYASPHGCSDSLPVALAQSGELRRLGLRCVHALAARDGVAYLIAGDRDRAQIYRAADGGTPQLLLAAVPGRSILGGLAVSERWVYFYLLWSGTYLARAPITGGELQLVAKGVGVNGTLFATDHEVLIEVANDYTCLAAFDERTAQLRAISNAANIWQIAFDDQNFYLATNGILRVSRR